MTRNRKATLVEDEGRIGDDKQQLVSEDEGDQLKEKAINEKEKEVEEKNDGEKEINEEEKQKEKEKMKKKKMRKIEKKRRTGRQRVSLQERRRKRLFHAQGESCHTLWCNQRKTRSNT